MPLEPLDDNADPWVMILERLEAKVLDPTLSLQKYLDKTFGKPLTTFPMFGLPKGPIYEPTMDQCPALVITTTTTDSPTDRGAGDERWTFTVMLYFKLEVKNSDQRLAVRACHELIRTLFYKWRSPGALDPLAGVPGMNKYVTLGDLSPEFFTGSRGGYSVAKMRFAIQFTVNEKILG